MTPVDNLLFEPVKPAGVIKRDRYGRYVIPDPDTGKERSWTRATTLAGTLADRFGLEQWAKRNVALGIGVRADLYARAASCTPDEKQELNAIVAQAEEASKSNAGANLGTALHRFTERLDAGEDISPPAPWDADVAAYRAAMEAHGIAVLPEWIERVLLVPELGVAGTCDRLCNAMEWTLPRIGDLKTGKDVLRYSMPEIAIQLSLYAHATHWFDPVAGQLHEIDLQVDQTKALVMHLPVGEASCTLYEVDIEAGWFMARIAAEVRDWRKRKDLAGQLVPTKALANGGLITKDQAPTFSEEPDCVVTRVPAGNSTSGPPRTITQTDTLIITPDTPAVEATPSRGNDQESDQGDSVRAVAEGVPPPPPAESPDPALSAPDSAGVASPTGDDGVDDADLHQQRLAWLKDRVLAIKDAGHGADLAREWSQHDEIPTFKAGGPRTLTEIETVVAMCWTVEKAHGIAFPEPMPGVAVFTKALRKAGMVNDG